MKVPALGFGTAPILGSKSGRQGRVALDRAWDAGVRHFDTARSYGWGEAEGFLGAFLSGRPRAEYTIVTKCGIVPARRSPALAMAKSLARAVLTLAPGLRGNLRKAAGASGFQPSRTFDIDALTRSADESLAALGIDRVDVLLLHNFETGIENFGDILALFRDLKSRGLVARYGFSVDENLARNLDWLGAAGALDDDAVIQVPVCDDLLNLSRDWANVPVIAHSPFVWLGQQGGAAGDFSGLFGRLAEASRCEALVCSMSEPAHIDANVAAWKAAMAR